MEWWLIEQIATAATFVADAVDGQEIGVGIWRRIFKGIGEGLKG